MVIKIQEAQIEEITNFLLKSKVIFHPRISPSGIPDFTNYQGRRFILILDRNILVPILDIVQTGSLNDPHKLKLISSLLFWSAFNGIAITSGFALMEHSHFQGDSIEASNQHNVFQSIFKQYSPQDWLAIALGIKSSIPRIDQQIVNKADYLIDNEHHILNYLQVLKLCQLHFRKKLPISEKMREFHQWSYDNVLIGMYSTFFAMMFFSSRTKLSKYIQEIDPEELCRKCRNVAWDLTYLSFWSTLYWNDNNKEEVYLFATRDKEMKDLIALVHTNPEDAYIKVLGLHEGATVKKELESIYIPRSKRTFENDALKKMILKEEDQLNKLIRENAI